MSTSLLKITSPEVLHQFIHYCVDELITTTNSNFVANNDLDWTKEDQLSAINFIQNTFRENTLLKPEEFVISEQNMDPKFLSIIKDCYNIRKDEIFQAILHEELYKTHNDIVENIDWKLKWVMGSSKLASLREPLLQVDLHCFLKENETTRKTVNFEMNLDQVNNLIEELEKMQKSLHSN